MKKIYKIITSLLTTILFIINFSPITALAEDINNTKTYITSDMAYSFSDLNTIAEKSYDIKDISIIEQYKTLAINSLNKININSNINNINTNDFKVIKTHINGQEYTSANFGITGKYSLLSNLNLLFDANNQLIFYSETLLSKNENNTFDVQNFVNGELFEAKETDIPFITDNQIKEGINGLKEAGQELQYRNIWAAAGCIASVTGINGVVAKLIAATCVSACAAAPIGGAVCAACIGGVCVMGAADIAAIVACFKL